MARFTGFMFKPAMIILIILWLTSIVRAQAPEGDVTINYAEATTLDTGEVKISAFVSVINLEGHPYTQLTADDFSVFENNTAIEKSSLNVALSTAPLTVTLLIDTSSNMAQSGPDGVRTIDAAKDAATTFIEALREKDRVAVYAYDTQARHQQDFSYDHNLAIDQGLMKLNATEAKAACLVDALLRVVEDSLAKPSGQRIIIVITGSPNGPIGEPCSSASIDDVLEAANTTGNFIPIFGVGFGQMINSEDLVRLSEHSGGRSLLAPDSTTLTPLLALLAEQLKSQYEISYITQAPSGPARLTITENSSQNTDRRQIFIPAAIEPTPTPLPQFAIDLFIDQKLDEGKLEVQVNVPADVALAKTELFINDKLDQQKVEPPFDRFELDIPQLGSGQHHIRVEATDKNGILASAEVELTLSIPPPPTPAPVPTPTAIPTVAPPTSTDSGLLGRIPLISLALILAGLLLLILLAGVMVYLFFIRSKRPAITSAAVAQPPPPDQETIIDIAPQPRVQPSPSPPPLAPDPRELQARRAKLVVLDGQYALAQNVFALQKLETKIGRNTPPEAVNDIPIRDKEVSRAHAKIIYHDRQFFIQDLKSSTGTKVNGTKLLPFQETALRNGAEVTIGPRVKFKFEFFAPRSINETLDNAFDQANGPLPKEDNDPDRTLYDF